MSKIHLNGGYMEEDPIRKGSTPYAAGQVDLETSKSPEQRVEAGGRKYFHIIEREGNKDKKTLTTDFEKSYSARIKDIYKYVTESAKEMERTDGKTNLNEDQLKQLKRINIEYPRIQKLSESEDSWFKNLKIKYQQLWNSAVSYFMNGGKTDETLARDVRRTAFYMEIYRDAKKEDSEFASEALKKKFLEERLNPKNASSPDEKYAINQFRDRNKLLIKNLQSPKQEGTELQPWMTKTEVIIDVKKEKDVSEEELRAPIHADKSKEEEKTKKPS